MNQHVKCTAGLILVTATISLSTTFAHARLPERHDVRNGALDASLIVIVRPQQPDVFQIEEVLLGDRKVGSMIRLPKFELYGPDELQRGRVLYPITDDTRILLLLLLEPRKGAPQELAVCFHGTCFFWVDAPGRAKELRDIANKALILRRSWFEARGKVDPVERVESLWPFMWNTSINVSRRTIVELKRTAPTAGDYIVEQFDELNHSQRMTCIVDAGEFGGEKLRELLKRHLTLQQRNYETYLAGEDAVSIDRSNALPREVTEIQGELYYGLTGLAKYRNREDLDFIRGLARWGIEHRFKQTCDAALQGFRFMPAKANLSLIDDIWVEFSSRPREGDALSPFDVTRSLRTYKFPQTVPILVRFLRNENQDIVVEAKSFLTEIVGKDLGAEPQPWLDWYAGHK